MAWRRVRPTRVGRPSCVVEHHVPVGVTCPPLRRPGSIGRPSQVSATVAGVGAVSQGRGVDDDPDRQTRSHHPIRPHRRGRRGGRRFRARPSLSGARPASGSEGRRRIGAHDPAPPRPPSPAPPRVMPHNNSNAATARSLAVIVRSPGGRRFAISRARAVTAASIRAPRSSSIDPAIDPGPIRALKHRPCRRGLGPLRRRQPISHHRAGPRS